MTEIIFFRLLKDDSKASRLSNAVKKLHEGGEVQYVYSADPGSLRQVPNSPFAYWLSESLQQAFVKLEQLESSDIHACKGPDTGDDFRFLRVWWEVGAEKISLGKRWVDHPKGGVYARYYSDVHLLIDWYANGEAIRRNGNMRNPRYFFRPGLTWSRRTTSDFSLRLMGAGCVFADKGPAVFVKNDDCDRLSALLGLMNSKIFQEFIKLQLGAADAAARSYEVGIIQSIPVPDLSDPGSGGVGRLAIDCFELKRGFDTANETSHAFYLPALSQVEGVTLQDRIALWQDRISSGEWQLAEYQWEIDDIAFGLYGIEGEDRRAIEESLNGKDGAATSPDSDVAAEAEDTAEPTATLDSGALAADLFSYTIGCVFGRWDARIALDSSLAPMLQDPFAPLPVCSPGVLVGPDGLPAKKDSIASEEWMRARPDVITLPPEGSVQNPTIPDSEYPLSVDWDGILVDDPGHPDDIVRRVREVLELVWGDRADAIEQEACELLGVKDLRTYFRNPRKFFDYHIKRYSKSRRKAPIYWLLQSPNRNYGLWLYYHSFDSDTLFKALKRCVEPKIRMEENRLEEYEAQRRSAGTGGLEAKRAEKAVEDQEALLVDLREFRDRLERAAKRYLRPDLNDGVVLNIAPLWELVPWKESKSKWNELLAGKYEWSSIGKQLREKGLV